MTRREADAHWDCGPAVVVGASADYPTPASAAVTRWRLRTPAGWTVGVLSFDGGGVVWRPADTGDADAREHAAEVLRYLRGSRAAGVPLADALAGVAAAYAGDLDEH